MTRARKKRSSRAASGPSEVAVLEPEEAPVQQILEAPEEHANREKPVDWDALHREVCSCRPPECYRTFASPLEYHAHIEEMKRRTKEK